MNRSLRVGLALAMLAPLTLLLAGCDGDPASPRPVDPQQLSLEIGNWADTLVMGDRRMVTGQVLDDQGREVSDRTLDWTVVDSSRLRLSDSTTSYGETLRLTALLPGTTAIGVHFLDAHSEEGNQSRPVTVVLAGVEVTSPGVTLTVVGDSAVITATALAHDSAGVNVAVAGQGLTWAHHGSAASLSGEGDLIRVHAVQDGLDTLVVSHPVCRAGAACADTVLVTVAIPADPEAGPTPGADLIVFNDINIWDEYGGEAPENHLFYENVMSFTGGVRASGHTVMFYNAADSRCAAYCSTTGGMTALTAKLTQLGYTLTDESGSLASIPADVKVIFVWTPGGQVPISDVNGLKQFAGQGGRIVLVGEHEAFMGPEGIAAENQLIHDLGGQLTNEGGCLVNGDERAHAEGTHQLVTGVAQIRMGCVSPMTPGPDDFVLFRAPTEEVVGAVVKIDLTPIPTGCSAVARAGVQFGC
jgi:hypothetical protein